MKYKAIELAIETENLWVKLKDFEFDFEIEDKIDIFLSVLDFNDPLVKTYFSGLLHISNSGNSDILLKDSKVNIYCLCQEDVKKGKVKFIQLGNVYLSKKYKGREIFDVMGSCDSDFTVRIL